MRLRSLPPHRRRRTALRWKIGAGKVKVESAAIPAGMPGPIRRSKLRLHTGGLVGVTMGVWRNRDRDVLAGPRLDLELSQFITVDQRGEVGPRALATSLCSPQLT
jgi:hypothetical protein